MSQNRLKNRSKVQKALTNKVKLKLVKGMKVMVMVGDDKGKTGVIKEVIREDRKVVVEGINLCKKSLKITETNNNNFVKVERPIHISNIAAFDEENKKPSKVGFKIVDGKKVRFLKTSLSEIK